MSDPTRGVATALADLAAGRVVVVVDEERKSGHFVSSALLASTQAIVLMSTYGRGVLTVALTAARLEQLGIPPIGHGEGREACRQYHVPVDLRGHDRAGVHTGRAATIRALADGATQASDLVSPGHVFPLVAAERGVLERQALPEAAIDLARLAGESTVAVVSDAVDEQGLPADCRAAARLARRLRLTMISVGDLVLYREHTEPAVRRAVDIKLPTRSGHLTTVGYESTRSEVEYVAFVHGQPRERADGVRVHIQARCLVGDVFGAATCDCGVSLRDALATIRYAGHGVVVYAGGRGVLVQRHLTGSSQPKPIGCEVELAHVLRNLGIQSVHLSSNELVDDDRLRDLGVMVAGPPATSPRHPTQTAAAAE